MKISIALYLLIFLFISVPVKSQDSIKQLDQHENYMVKKETSYCQRAPDKMIFEKSFEYNELNQKIKEISSDGYSREFKYNNRNLLEQETTYREKQITSIVNYVYDNNYHLVTKTTGSFYGDSAKHSAYTYEYKNGNLYKENTPYRAWTIYEYKKDTISTKVYNEWGKLHKWFVTSYTNGLQVEETHFNSDEELLYTKKYEYNNGLLVRITEKEKVIQENIYKGTLLIEKRTYYFGIDPGIDICWMNYITKYEY